MSNVKYLYQLVWCSQREGRVFRRELAISKNSVMVTKVEPLPPGYEYALERMRAPKERMDILPANLSYADGYSGCPFCGNAITFECSCGTISCMSGDHTNHHACPVCHVLHAPQDADHVIASPTGFTSLRGLPESAGGGQRGGLKLPAPPQLPIFRGPNFASERPALPAAFDDGFGSAPAPLSGPTALLTDGRPQPGHGQEGGRFRKFLADLKNHLT